MFLASALQLLIVLRAVSGSPAIPIRVEPFRIGKSLGDTFDENLSRTSIGATVFWIVVYFSVVAVAGLFHFVG
jgi:hypothetical protein